MSEEIKDLEDLIDLQNAHVTQHTKDGIRGEWSVELNITNKRIQTFSPQVTDVDMASIMAFSKKYELVAFNSGIKFQKGIQNKVLVAEIAQLKKALTEVADENVRLATILDQHIGE